MKLNHLFGLIPILGYSLAAGQTPRLSIESYEPGTTMVIGEGPAAGHQHLEVSADLQSWHPVKSWFDQPNWVWEHQSPVARKHNFYRSRHNPPLVDLAQENVLLSPRYLPDYSNWPIEGETSDPNSLVAISVHKFLLILDDLPKVYFVPKHSLEGQPEMYHYQYVANFLDAFDGISLGEYARISEPGPDAIIVPGTLYYSFHTGEVGFEFVGQERYPADSLNFFINSLVASLREHEDEAPLILDEVFYVPTFGQRPLNTEEEDWLATHNIHSTSIARWLNNDICYSEGWALGRLRYFPADQIENAFFTGQLLPSDILLTDVVPAELPNLAGIITLNAINPASHPVLLAKASGIPMAFISESGDQEQLLSLADSEILISAGNNPRSKAQFVDVSAFSEADRSEILGLKVQPELQIQPIERMGSIVVSDLAGLSENDIQYVGGKAANFRFLRRELPDNSPDAIAFTFDLWEDYLNQPLPGGQTLREEISGRLAPFSWPPNVQELEDKLSEIRDLFTDTTDFSPSRKTAILSALTGFPSDQRLRFRSSTNVEDSERSLGAGLYSSYSGCVLDDTDGDDVGPSHCDPTRSNERGVFRALRKVYASFYNTNAVLERLRYGVDESSVGMAVLVHPSFPDEIEAANGVAISQLYSPFTIVTQRGAVPVTNPQGDQLPEIVSYKVAPEIVQRSQLDPEEGISVMEMPEDYRFLKKAMETLEQAYESETSKEGSFDIEFKKLTDDSIVIKQFRRIPEPANSQPDTFISVGESLDFIIDQSPTILSSNTATVFSKHRLKATLQLESNPQILNDEGFDTPFFTFHLRVLEGSEYVEYSGDPLGLPGASYESNPVEDWVRVEWEGSISGESIRYSLTLDYSEAAAPLLALDTFQVALDVDYSVPRLAITGYYFAFPLSTTTRDTIFLEPRKNSKDVMGKGSLENMSVETESGINVESEYFLSPGGDSLPPDFASDFRGWKRSTITGLTSEPITFAGDFSRSHWVGRHNLVEFSIFDPFRENLDPALLSELRNADVAQILMVSGHWSWFEWEPPKITLIDFNGNPTPLTTKTNQPEGE